MSIGEGVRKIRHSRGLKQRELAEMTGLSQVTISRLETGRQKSIDPKALKKISSALGISVVQVMTGLETETHCRADSEGISHFLVDFFSLEPSKKETVMRFTAFIKKGKQESSGAIQEQQNNESPG